MSSTEERVAIVTGASQGLGYAIAAKLVQEGKKVAFVSLGLDSVKAEFERETGEGRVIFCEMDVSDNAAIARCVEDVTRSWGRIDILVNNAGIRTETAIEEIGPEEWNRIMAVNLGGTFFFSQAVVPVMKEQKWGRIINMSSFGGQFGPLTSSAAYSASKAGQIALTKVFARTLAEYGITVNAIAPAAIRTPEMDKIPADALAGMVRTIPVGRVGEAAEVAELVSYLVSDYGGFVTGATMDINGGRLMR
ncbi:SDR family NAD(P)-dependent oxidoreductase [Paenibacillus beijingensis]|uniref:3-oxoacyl-ACP reductase n=1 Tax=Paenibacillus beijingensis TaxID=1126833 RepID=A0A0D5NLX7_9BACL|nr:SDR family NAD(P)-dependent oxidoreductase [Paenibacillus beijingensis]AJY76135.1 3-oxoacyl-ACP reductase [Paenibacillus beijingensis]